jgi:hypothetical protein
MKAPAELDVDIPPYNPRLVRRATRRGLVRSAFRVIVILLLGSLVLQVMGGLWGQVRGRKAHFQTVAEGAFMAAHPELSFGGGSCCMIGLRLNEATKLDWSVRTADDTFGVTGSTTVHNNAWGDTSISNNALGNTRGIAPLKRAMNGLRPEKAATRRLLAQLPGPVLTMAIIELNAPAAPDDFNRRYSTPTSPIFGAVYLTDPYHPQQAQVTWPTANLSGANTGGAVGRSFAQWTAQLHNTDDHNLRMFGLPDAHTLQELGRAPRVYAFVVQDQTPDQITRYLDDPAVRSVNIVDVAYNLNQTP